MSLSKRNNRKKDSSGNIEIGNIYKIEADTENDITPPDGRISWHKHFVVMGKAQDGSLYGCVVFDSKINKEYLIPGTEEFYIPIAKGTYSFIDHDSYLECLKLKPATSKKLLQGKFEGKLNDTDLEKAMNLVKMSPRHSFILLKAYGIL